MARVYVETTVHTESFEKMLKETPHKVQMATRDATQLFIDDVREHWSGYYPPASSPGATPAIRSGKLDESGRVRFVKGGLVSLYRAAFEVVYAKWLEKGTPHGRMEARPFLLPAVERIKRKLKDIYRVVLKP